MVARVVAAKVAEEEAAAAKAIEVASAAAAAAAAKAAVDSMTRSLALEWGELGIRVNAIAPETTETAHVTPAQWMSNEDYQRQSQWIPLGRFGQPEDSAGCALFLASNLSQWVTGTTIHCDGGALAAAGWYRNRKGQWTNTPIVDRGALDSLMPD